MWRAITNLSEKVRTYFHSRLGENISVFWWGRYTGFIALKTQWYCCLEESDIKSKSILKKRKCLILQLQAKVRQHWAKNRLRARAATHSFQLLWLKGRTAAVQILLKWIKTAGKGTGLSEAATKRNYKIYWRLAHIADRQISVR